MRAVLVLALTAARAAADVGIGFFGLSARYGDQPNQAFGPAGELSLDTARWQLFVEATLAEMRIAKEILGTQVRGAVGARYLARRFEHDELRFDLGFELLAGVQDIEWDDAPREWRPEVSAGFQWRFGCEHGAIRVSLRAAFTPSPTTSFACHGPCPSGDAITSGYVFVLGVGW